MLRANFFCEYLCAFSILKTPTQLRKLCNFIANFFNAHRNFGNVVTNLFDYFFSFLLLFRIGQFVTTEIDYAEEQCDLRYAWNEVKRSCLLPPSWRNDRSSNCIGFLYVLRDIRLDSTLSSLKNICWNICRNNNLWESKKKKKIEYKDSKNRRLILEFERAIIFMYNFEIFI